ASDAIVTSLREIRARPAHGAHRGRAVLAVHHGDVRRLLAAAVEALGDELRPIRAIEAVALALRAAKEDLARRLTVTAHRARLVEGVVHARVRRPGGDRPRPLRRRARRP